MKSPDLTQQETDPLIESREFYRRVEAKVLEILEKPLSNGGKQLLIMRVIGECEGHIISQYKARGKLK